MFLDRGSISRKLLYEALRLQSRPPTRPHRNLLGSGICDQTAGPLCRDCMGKESWQIEGLKIRRTGRRRRRASSGQFDEGYFSCRQSPSMFRTPEKRSGRWLEDFVAPLGRSNSHKPSSGTLSFLLHTWCFQLLTPGRSQTLTNLMITRGT